MQFLQSISRIEKIIPTAGSQPVMVMCGNYDHYICKYGKPHDLFNEYLAASFCRIWGISVPDFCFINVKPEHVKEGLDRRLFAFPCYGSFYLEYAQDVNSLLTTWERSPRDLAKIINSDDLLKIALFDLWIGNEDRNHNNFNLLINPTLAGNIITAIDHVAIFNSNTLERGMVQLSEDESIIKSEIFKMFFRRGPQLSGLLNDLEENFYLYVARCQVELPNFLRFLPPDWKIDPDKKGSLLVDNLFSKRWLNETIQSFKLYLELGLK